MNDGCIRNGKESWIKIVRLQARQDEGSVKPAQLPRLRRRTEGDISSKVPNVFGHMRWQKMRKENGVAMQRRFRAERNLPKVLR